MNHKEEEIRILKNEINHMWKLVISQVEKAKQAFLTNDIALASEIARTEKHINSLELHIESNCENYIALYSPVAIDLRFILSIMKINITLERIADYAFGIAQHIIDRDCDPLDKKLITAMKLEKMFDLLIHMMADCLVALNAENSHASEKIMAKDKEVNAIYYQAIPILEAYVQHHPEQTHCGLKLMLLIRKMERIGDHCCNIVEEIVFYVEAKVLKHKGKLS